MQGGGYLLNSKNEENGTALPSVSAGADMASDLGITYPNGNSDLGRLPNGFQYMYTDASLITAMHNQTATNDMLTVILDRTDLTGREKLKMIFKESILRPVQDDIFTVAPDLSKNPRLLFSIFHETVKEVAPDYILPIIEQGRSDGTIQTDYPAALAELIICVANIWMNPMIFDNTAEESYGKFMVFRQMMKGFGLDIVDDEMLGRLQELAVIYQENK